MIDEPRMSVLGIGFKAAIFRSVSEDRSQKASRVMTQTASVNRDSLGIALERVER